MSGSGSGKVNLRFRKKLSGNKIPKDASKPSRNNVPNQTIGGQVYTTGNLGVGRGTLISGLGGTSMIVEKTEPFGSVIANASAGDFKASIDQRIFPMSGNLNWLQNMANSFSSYEVLALEVTYIPAVPTTASGSIAMSFYEDSLDVTPTSRSQLLVSEQSLFAPVYAGGEGGRYLQQFGSPKGNIVSFMVPKHAIQDAAGNPKRFKICKPDSINTMLTEGALTGEAVLSNYVVGRLVVGTDGCAASQNVGEVFLRYRIRLSGQVSISNQR